MTSEQSHKGWTERDLRRVLPHVPDNVKTILAYIAEHPNCTTRDMARDLPIKSERSVGPTLNSLTRISVEMGVFPTKNAARWPFEYGKKTDAYERYDMPAWVRAVVRDTLGTS